MLTHVDKSGNAKMVDVGAKKDQLRVARATGKINLKLQTLSLIKDNEIKKGDVLTVSKIAAIQAAKQTFSLIPLCHPLQINNIDISFEISDAGAIVVFSEVKSTGKTGVEMEALTAVSVALLTIYDMCKAVDKEMAFSDIKLIEKTKTDI